MFEPSLPGNSAKRVFAPDDPAIHLVFQEKQIGSGWMRGSSPRMTLGVCGNAGDRRDNRPSGGARMTFMLETRDLTIRFGGHVAVNRVSCSFRPGELTAIVGPNGAGKTTYFNLISGQLRPSDGSILLDGADITQLSAPLRTRAGLGRAFQLTNLFPNLSVEENVRLAVQSESGVHYEMLRPWTTRRDLIARADAILDKVALGGRRSVPATALSHGDQRKLEVALMMALEPKVFMFDEPTAGMSIDEVPVVLNLIAQLKQDASKIILLVEHKMDVVRSLADRIIVLHNGQLVADGKPADVIASPIVQEAYLGIAPGKSAA
jgi:branched-chain amino acid transport system ATP-binding protein